MKSQLLLFWSRHPQSEFTLDSIRFALDTGRLELVSALQTLMAERVVEKREGTNGVAWYSLSPSWNKQRPVLKLAGMDPLIAEQGCKKAGVRPGVGV